jgi:hypothetical protein
MCRWAVVGMLVAMSAVPVSGQGTPASPPAVLRGFILADSSEAPLVNAEISIASLGLRALAAPDGSFRIGGIAAGQHVVAIRTLGYEPLSARLQFSAGDSLERDFLLVRAPVAISGVEVTAKGEMSRNPKIATFESRMRTGHGRFITGATLDSMAHRRMGEILASRIAGATVVTRQSSAWVGNRRGRTSLVRRQGLQAADRARGADPNVCYSAVYLDGTLVYSGQDQEPLFDVNSIQPADVAGIEYYAGGAQVPVELNATLNTCGVLVIWTR